MDPFDTILPPPAPAPAGGDVAAARTVQSALVAYGRGKWSEAEQLCRIALAARPDSFSALHVLGLIAAQTGRSRDAVEFLAGAVSANPSDASAHANLGAVLQAMRRHAEAVASCDRALELKPDFAEAWNNRGTALRDLRRPAEALKSFERAIALKPDYAEAHSNRGNALHDLERFGEALLSYERAIRIKPDYVEAYTNRGAALLGLRRLDDALASYEDAIRLKPDYADVYEYRGDAFRQMKRIDDALLSYETAISIKPDSAEAHFKKADLLLLAGDYQRGWDLYEWRWKSRFRVEDRRRFDYPVWTGEQAVAGKTVLICPEVGLGDFIMFVRYAPMLEELGARVVLHAPLALVALLSTMEGNVSVVEEGHSIAGVDLQCPIMSLPRAFKTTIDTIPARVPYLAVPPEKQAYWRERLGRPGKRRVGLAWSGKANRNIDLNPATSRSVPLRLLAPLLQLPLELHSLQKETLESDADILSRFEQIRTHHGELNDFSDTAALVEEMDLVISIDTAVAHLAGALAKPLWMMLPYSSDYRWGIGGDRTPWYPAARLFRQSHISDWEGVVWRVASELAGMQ